jgi:hypothetical protein
MHDRQDRRLQRDAWHDRRAAYGTKRHRKAVRHLRAEDTVHAVAVPQLGAAAAAAAVVADNVAAAAARERQLRVLAGALALARLGAAAVPRQRVCTAAGRQASPTAALRLQLVPLRRLLLLLLRLLLSCQRLDKPQVRVTDAAVAQLHAHSECVVRKQQQKQTKQRKADDGRGLTTHACPHVQAIPSALLICPVVVFCCAAVSQHGTLHVIQVAATTEHAGVPATATTKYQHDVAGGAVSPLQKSSMHIHL